MASNIIATVKSLSRRVQIVPYLTPDEVYSIAEAAAKKAVFSAVKYQGKPVCVCASIPCEFSLDE